MRLAMWLVAGLSLALASALAQQGGASSRAGVHWIWLDEGDPVQYRPIETVFFRRTFVIDRPFQKVVDEGTLDITADNEFTVWVNGVEVGRGDRWEQVYQFDVSKLLVHGKNVIAVRARNIHPSAAGLLVRLAYVPNGQDRRAVVSDGSWKAIKDAPEGWHKPDFDDSRWPAVKVLGPYGRTGPWRSVVWPGGGDDRFSVPAGFIVEQAVKIPPGDVFSLVNLCFDARGRLLVSREGGPILLCTDPDAHGVLQTVRVYCEQVRNSQGMCWVEDALLLVGDGPEGTGLYRVRDTNGDDRTDQVELLHRFRGGMGEHGPHAILHGPDNLLYLVIGNHAWAQPARLAANSPLTRWPTGYFGPDQGRPDTTEDVLLPRLNDSRGHAANILAPGGTIWRLDHRGENLALVAAGFRNQYDAAFHPDAELFTFDSDMEWDEGLPWYRAVRVCHCPPGADFVWRTGSANTPDYYIDSLPPLLETGRGSPVGVEIYDHHAFPESYRGALFLADWSLGVIYAVHLQRQGATYRGKAERFCVGAPMNVTDIAVGPEGALYFSLGGRGTRGGVFCIRYTRNQGTVPTTQRPAETDLAGRLLGTPQPLAAYSRPGLRRLWQEATAQERAKVLDQIGDAQGLTPQDRARLLHLVYLAGGEIPAPTLLRLADDAAVEVRAAAILWLGTQALEPGKQIVERALADPEAFVRRRACEALIRAGWEPAVEVIWPRLADPDRFVRHAARLVLARIPPEKWAERIAAERVPLAVMNAIVVLCQTNQALSRAELIFDKLHHMDVSDRVEAYLDYLRTLQLALIHTTERPGSVRGIALDCWERFPHSDARVNRELAILLTAFRRENILDEPVHARLLQALHDSSGDRPQQIHYFYCLRLLHQGWTPQQKEQLLSWFETTRTWTGGHSFTPFLEHILRDALPIFDAEDRAKVLARASERPWTAAVLIRYMPAKQMPAPQEIVSLYRSLSATGNQPHVQELKEAIVSLLVRDLARPGTQEALAEIAAFDPSRLEQVARNLARRPDPRYWPLLVRGLQSNNADVLLDLIRGLRRLPNKPTISQEPRPEEAVPFRLLLLASGKLPPQERMQAVELLRHWKDQRFALDADDWKTELEGWSRWFGQTFPKEPPLPNVTAVAPQSKWNFEELLAFLESPSGRGDPGRGRSVFEKASCIKCHKFGAIGEGLGPDLTTLRSRFKRADMLESLLYPSKVISDQYRGTKILTKDGATISGLAVPQGDIITVLQSDGTKVVLKLSDVDARVASTVSPMPEKLLDDLSKQEIADLFAYLESEPPK